MKPTLLHMYLYTSTVSRSFAAYLHHSFRIKILQSKETCRQNWSGA